jgi:uncharacterized membrane protein
MYARAEWWFVAKAVGLQLAGELSLEAERDQIWGSIRLVFIVSGAILLLLGTILALIQFAQEQSKEPATVETSAENRSQRGSIVIMMIILGFVMVLLPLIMR